MDPTIKDKDGNYINDIMQIIQHYTEVGSNQWLSQDKTAAAEAVKALKKLKEKAMEQVDKENDRRGDYTAEEVRKAAKKLKGGPP